MGEDKNRGIVNLTPAQQMELQTENLKLKSNLQQASRLINQLQESLSIKRMDYLFKILEFKDMFSDELLHNIVAEIEETFKPVQQPEQTEQPEQPKEETNE